MIRVLIVDDDPLVRSGLTMMLGGAADMEVVGEAANGADVVDAVTRLAPHVVLMDVRMPVLDGVAATTALSRRPDPVRGGDLQRPAVVMLTTFHADETVLAALRAGAAGFLLKHTAPAEIVDAVRRAAAGDPVLSPGVTRSVIAMAPGAPARRGRPRGLRRPRTHGPAHRPRAPGRPRGVRRAEQRGDRRAAAPVDIEHQGDHLQRTDQARPDEPDPARDPRPRVAPRLTRWQAGSGRA